MNDLQTFIDTISIAPEVYALCPDGAVLALGIDNVIAGLSDEVSASWLDEACLVAREVDHTPHLEAWRAAYRAFDLKPQKFRPSFDALLRRSSTGLPQINRVVDVYNAVSVKYGLPIGGENVDGYDGPLRLVRANGTERFDTIVNAEPAVEIVDCDEVVWLDDCGVTCRRWNWRQCLRTRVHVDTSRVFFLFERLAPFPMEQLNAAAEEVTARVRSSDSLIVTRLIKSAHTTGNRPEIRPQFST